MASVYDTRMRELKTTADLGYKQFIRLNDMTSEKECEFSLKSSNVVISAVGSRIWRKKEHEFEEANIRVPMAIAKAVRNNPNIKRYIHISAAGADPNS